jgi:hypothetical protein
MGLPEMNDSTAILCKYVIVIRDLMAFSSNYEFDLFAKIYENFI